LLVDENEALILVYIITGDFDGGGARRAGHNRIGQIRIARHHPGIHLHPRCGQRRRGAIGGIQFPPPAQRGGTDQATGRRDLGASRRGEPLDQRLARRTGTGEAAPQPQPAAGTQRMADRGEIRRLVGQRLGRPFFRCERDAPRRAVGDDMNRVQIPPSGDCRRNLTRGRPRRI
jgi:hypothetical protein